MVKIIRNNSGGGAGTPAQGTTQGNPFTSLSQLSGIPSGNYYIRANGVTYIISVDDSEGGGWVLCGNYVRQAGTNPIPEGLPGFPLLDPTAVLGDDGSSGPYWGTSTFVAMQNLESIGPFNEIRYYGESSSHGRILHFKSTNKTDHVDLVINGGGGTWTTLLDPPGVPGVLDARTILLTGHTALLPTSADNFNFASNGGDFDAVMPMAQVGWFKGGAEAYLVYRNANGWAMDESGVTFNHDSIHRMWMRA